MLSKTTEFYKSTLASNYDIIALTETWLSSGVSDCEIFDCSEYNVFRCDRDFQRVGLGRGGGVLLAVRGDCQSLQIDRGDLSIDLDEFCLIDFVIVKVIKRGITFYIAVIYVPPRTALIELERTMRALEDLHLLLGNRILVVGDFNIAEYWDCRDGTIPNTSRMQIINNFCAFHNLIQFNTILNHNSRLLDLVLSSFPCVVIDPPDVLLNEDAHHPALLIELDSGISTGVGELPLRSSGYNFRKADFLGMYGEFFGANWDFLYSYDDPNSAVTAFYDRLYEILDKHVPRRGRSGGAYPAWFNGKIIAFLKRKRRAWARYKRVPSAYNHDRFRQLRSQTKSLISQSFHRYNIRIERDIKTDPKAFWSYIDAGRSNVALPSVMVYNGSELRSSAAMADAFADSFMKGFNSSSAGDTDRQVAPDNRTSSFLQLSSVAESEVLSSLRRIPSGQTTGPDLIPAFLLRDCAVVLCAPLHFIFNLILRTSIYPDVWKESRVRPVYKKGNKNDVNNYRPIAIINNFSKSFEFVLHDSISSFASRLLTTSQHGFVPGRSTTTNLACITQTIAEGLDRRHQVDVVYTDFSKAFDRLNHSLLVDKLASFGFSASLVGLFRSYLDGRRQYVQCNGFCSSTYVQPSGVPQGTVLGPDLFLIFIDDIVADLDVPCLLYADDMKLYQTISTLDDCIALQRNLDILHGWCIRNQLPLNIEKCSVLSYRRTVSPLLHDYMIDGKVLRRPLTVRDLGVTFDARLTFTVHIESVISKALRMLGFILRRCKHMTNIMTFRILFMSFVRTRLEYASIVWAPTYEVHITSLENIQRKFLKASAFMMTGSYPDRGTPQQDLLRQFNMQSLRARRDMHSVVFLHKIIGGDIDCPELLYRIGFRIPRPNSRSTQLLHLPYARTHVLASSPLHHMFLTYADIETHCDILHTSVPAIREIFQYSRDG